MKNKGITLVALVITIIILLILAGVAISQLTNSGLLKNSEIAKSEYLNAQQYEENEFNAINKEFDRLYGVVPANRDEPSKIINDFEIEVTKKLATSITVRVTDVDTTDGSDVKGYIYFVGDKVVKVSEDSECKLGGLTKETFYDGIYVLAIDENGKLKKSTNTIELTTASNIYAEWKAYNNKTGTYETTLKENSGFTASGNSIQIAEAGTYHFNYSWWTSGWTTNAHWLKVYKNGTEVKKLDPTNKSKKTGTFDLQCAQGDVILVKQYTDNGSYPTSIDLVMYSDFAPFDVNAQT